MNSLSTSVRRKPGECPRIIFSGPEKKNDKIAGRKVKKSSKAVDKFPNKSWWNARHLAPFAAERVIGSDGTKKTLSSVLRGLSISVHVDSTASRASRPLRVKGQSKNSLWPQIHYS